MIGIRVSVAITNDFKHLPMPASEWMFGPMSDFTRKARVYSPYWTGALRSSVDMEELPDGSGYIVSAGDPEIVNPITKTPTDQYAPEQEAEKGFMIQAYLDSRTEQKLLDAASRLFR